MSFGPVEIFSTFNLLVGLLIGVFVGIHFAEKENKEHKHNRWNIY